MRIVLSQRDCFGIGRSTEWAGVGGGSYTWGRIAVEPLVFKPNII